MIAFTAIKVQIKYHKVIITRIGTRAAGALALALPQSLISLDLSNTELVERSGATVALLTNLHITTLIMQHSSFSLIKDSATFKCLPRGLLYLDYRYNQSYLDDLSYFEELPPSLTGMALNYGDFIERTPEALFAVLPKTLSTLALQDKGPEPIRDASRVSLANLISIIEKIPPNITTLDLSNNHLARFSPSELQQLRQAIPPHIKLVNLSDNNLFDKKSIAEVEELFIALDLQNQGKRFKLEGNVLVDLQPALLAAASLVGRPQQTPSGVRAALPVDIWANILSYVSSSPTVEKTNESKLLTVMAKLELIQLPALQTAMDAALKNYTNYRNGEKSTRGERGYSSRFLSSQHTSAVLAELNALNKTVQAAHNDAEARQAIQDFF